MQAKKNNRKRVGLIIGLIFVILIVLCIIIFIFSFQALKSNEKISSFEDSINPTNTPVIIITANTDYIEGISLSIGSITRFLSNDPEEQVVKIQYLVESKDTYWTGFEFEVDEWIIDTELGRVSAISVTNNCLIHDNENCIATITFGLPIEVGKLSLFYVSNRRFDDLEPIEVDEAADRRFVAEINLESIYLAPTNTPEPSKTITPSPTITPTSLYTPTLTSTPTITLTPTKTKTPTYDVEEIYWNYMTFTELQFKEYKNEIIGKQISSLVQIGQVTDDGKLVLSGDWSESIINYYDFCVIVELVPNDIALSFEKGEYIELEALINGLVGDNRYYWNCENTLILNYISHE